eukprot:scaffold40704_cov67-Skeletonema_dohrnii-CCMP3373.AAC.1
MDEKSRRLERTRESGCWLTVVLAALVVSMAPLSAAIQLDAATTLCAISSSYHPSICARTALLIVDLPRETQTSFRHEDTCLRNEEKGDYSEVAPG